MAKKIIYKSVHHCTTVYNVLLWKISNTENLKEKQRTPVLSVYLDSTTDSILACLKVSCQYLDTSSSISYANGIYNSKVLERTSTAAKECYIGYRILCRL